MSFVIMLFWSLLVGLYVRARLATLGRQLVEETETVDVPDPGTGFVLTVLFGGIVVPVLFARIRGWKGAAEGVAVIAVLWTLNFVSLVTLALLHRA